MGAGFVLKVVANLLLLLLIKYFCTAPENIFVRHHQIILNLHFILATAHYFTNFNLILVKKLLSMDQFDC